MLIAHTLAVAFLLAPPAGTGSPEPAPASSTAPAPSAFESAAPEVIAEGYRFVEGPMWLPGKGGKPGRVIFCEYPSSTIYAVTPGEKPEVFLEKSEGAIGSAMDAQGRLYLAQAKARRIVRLDPRAGGWAEPVVLADKWDGQPLNDTNDLTVAKDGTVYFTDPTFFNRGQFKLKHKGVYRITPAGELRLECDTLKLPNGAALSPDGKRLFVNEFGEGKVMAFDIGDDGALGKPTLFADLKSFGKPGRGGADGLKVLPDGRVLTTGPGGLFLLSDKGKFIDFVPIASVSNVAVGGEDGRDVFVTAGSKVLKVRMK